VPRGDVSELAGARGALEELAPVLRRGADLDPGCLARIRVGAGAVSVLVRLPFDVLVSRTVTGGSEIADLDLTVRAADLLAWLDGSSVKPPERLDEQWRGGLPPAAGWRRLDAVPDDVVRGLVRTGALTLKDMTNAAVRDHGPGAQPPAAASDALLNSIVLTVTDDDAPPAEIPLRALSALTRMAFLPRGSHIVVAVAGRWTRIAAEYGSVYLERPGLALLL
jgi:hypothetical protein